MVRFFKPGDRVQHRNGGPVMTVQKYVREYKLWVGWQTSEDTLECSWLDPEKGYQTKVFHQNSLIKHSGITGLMRRTHQENQNRMN